jgi:hypothetical protein
LSAVLLISSSLALTFTEENNKDGKAITPNMERLNEINQKENYITYKENYACSLDIC